MNAKDYCTNFLNSLNEENKTLLIEFFILFSRFEYALKTSITFAEGNEKKVGANWSKFVSSISNAFISESNSDLKSAVEYIMLNPPNIQVFVDGNIKWRSREFLNNEPEINKLCQHIKDIRNNLFHGGKFNSINNQEISRDTLLLKSSMLVLNNWVQINDNVRDKFFEEI